MTERKSKKISLVVAEPAPTKTNSGYIMSRLREPSTYMGILSIAALFATGGMASWLNPSTLPAIAAGLGLILTKETA